MNGSRVGALVMGMCLLSCLSAGPSLAVEDSASTKRLEEQKQDVRDQLNGSSWMLELKPESGGKARQDTLSFSERTVESDWLTQTGYSISNYSVRFDGDMAVWETMQSKDGDGRAFWRGELQGEKMYGTLSTQPQKGDPQTFAFSATKIASALPVIPQMPEPVQAPAPTDAPAMEPAADAAAAPQAAIPAVAPAASDDPAPKKKKRSLF